MLKIGAKEPTERALIENAHGLARYAVICQVRVDGLASLTAALGEWARAHHRA